MTGGVVINIPVDLASQVFLGMSARQGSSAQPQIISLVGMNLTLRQLRVFCAMYERHSFTRSQRTCST